MSYEQLPDKSLPPVTYATRAPRLRRPPFWMTSAIVILIVASWVPLVLIARARVTPSPEPRVQFVQDMGTQPKYREQQSSEIFADGRADRLPVPGTVARGQLMEDDNYYKGYTSTPGKPAKFFDGYPSEVTVDLALVERGQNRFNIYCAPCHGLDGSGTGPVHLRATELQESKWVPPANLHSASVRARLNGHLFNTISVGIRNMPGYASQVPVADRWAIVSYLRALQLSQDAPPEALTTEQLNALK
ncbi:MAG TPA: cytochrome c [Tepidisphaeraceae bacterium]|jgi:mono/diheme cytochrome c family protein|nr:cytochrome c [Tepidisphaeraceae bacterium]